MGYTAFGSVYAPATSVSVEQRYTYTGREKTTDPSLMYYRYRMYGSNVGRFVQRDPIHNDIDRRKAYSVASQKASTQANTSLAMHLKTLQGVSLPNPPSVEYKLIYGQNNYSYVRNMPQLKRDPTGLEEQGCGWIVEDDYTLFVAPHMAEAAQQAFHYKLAFELNCQGLPGGHASGEIILTNVYNSGDQDVAAFYGQCVYCGGSCPCINGIQQECYHVESQGCMCLFPPGNFGGNA